MSEKIFFKNSKGLKLCGILEEFDKEKIVIIVHGFASSKDGKSSRTTTEELTKRKISSFRIDLNGCGESEGDFSEHTISKAADDVSSAIKLMEEKGFQNIELLGSSAGGLTVMVTALNHPEIKKIGLQAPVSDYPSQRTKKLGEETIKNWKRDGFIFKLRKDGQKLKINYSFLEDAKQYIMYNKVKEIKCPVLVIHGDADNMVDLEQSKRVVKGFPNGRLIILKGANHGLDINGDRTLGNGLFGDWFEGKEITFTEEMELYVE